MSKLREELKTLQIRTVTAERNRVWIYMQLVEVGIDGWSEYDYYDAAVRRAAGLSDKETN